MITGGLEFWQKMNEYTVHRSSFIVGLRIVIIIIIIIYLFIFMLSGV